MTVKEMAKIHGINYQTVCGRLKKGMTLDEALTKPPENKQPGKYIYYIITADKYEYTLEIFDSMTQCAEFLGCSLSNISYAARDGRVVKKKYKILREERDDGSY